MTAVEIAVLLPVDILGPELEKTPLHEYGFLGGLVKGKSNTHLGPHTQMGLRAQGHRWEGTSKSRFLLIVSLVAWQHGREGTFRFSCATGSWTVRTKGVDTFSRSQPKKGSKPLKRMPICQNLAGSREILASMWRNRQLLQT